MPISQQSDLELLNSWIVCDTLDTDGEILRYCVERDTNSLIRASVVSLIFVIVMGVTQPTPSAVILGTQLLVTFGGIGSYQGGKLEAPYINRVISKENGTNDGVAYSILEAYNGIQVEKANAEGVAVVTKNSGILGKIAGVAMGWITLTPVKVLAEEMAELHTEKIGIKATISAFLALVTAWAGFPILNVIAGLTFMAVFDVLFSLAPGAVKLGTEIDHRLQAKLWAFIMNLGGIIFASVAYNVYLSLGAAGWAKTITCSINYLVATWLVSIYVIRDISYIARVNKVFVPWFAKLLAKNKNS